MAARLATLDEIAAAIWRELAAAAGDQRHAWRTPVLATTDGEAADARTVVLREVNADARELLVYSDARAAKVAQLRAHPCGTLVMWSKRLGWQLRCRVQLAVQEEGLSVASRWARVKLSPSAQDYLSPLPPGAPLDGAAPAVEHREHFAVITAVVDELDWLELHPQGHRRAVFARGTSRWVQP